MSNQDHYAHNLKSWWTVDYYDTGASGWVSDNAIPAPSLEFSSEMNSTSQISTMADGELGRCSYENSYVYDSLTLGFHKKIASASLINQFYNYLNEHTGIKITAQDDSEFEGYVEDVKVSHALPNRGNIQKYYLEVIFQQMSVEE